MGLVSGLPGTEVSTSDCGKEVSWKGPVSSSLTRSGDGRLEVASALAMFDQVTTWSCFTGDKYCRPGVSVTLNAWLDQGVVPEDLPLAGEMIEIKARLVQSGRVLGFMEAELRDCNSGKLLVKGNHHKYLPMDAMTKFWNLLFSPQFKHLPGMTFMNFSIDQAMKKNPDRGSNIGVSSLEELLDLESNADGTTVIFKPTKIHGNPMGSVHGGASVIVGAEAAGNANKIHGISASYLGAGKLGVPLLASRTALEKDNNTTNVSIYRDDRPSSPIFIANYFNLS